MHLFIRSLDFKLLKSQKSTLLKLVGESDDVPTVESLEGLIGMINEIQDIAVDTYGYDEDVVFNIEKES